MRTNPDKEQKEEKRASESQSEETSNKKAASKEQAQKEGGIKLPDAPKIELPKGGGAIRSIGEKFQANPVTGTGSFTAPIAMTQGRGGFSPALTLSYNSGSGNSPYGIGWSIGLPTISRSTQKELPQYKDSEESDTFIMSGAEDLVPALVEDSGNWIRDQYTETGYNIYRYRPRTEGLFARIERWVDTSTGISHWKSITRDNISTVYGKSASCRITDPNNAQHVFQWMIEETWDDKGNVIQYEYKAEDGAGVAASSLFEKNRLGNGYAQRYLKTVKYGNTLMRNDANYGSSNAWLFSLVLDYGEHATTNPTETEANTWTVRQDPFSTYRAGFEVRTWRLCKRILMFHHFTGTGEYDGIVKSTDLTYNENAVATQLSRVQHTSYQSGEDPASMPPLDFTYSQASMDDTLRHFDLEDLENLPMGVDGQQYLWTDLYGEGITGVLTEEPGGWFYKRNEGDESYYYDYPVSSPPEPDIRFGAQETVATKPNIGGVQQVSDFNGDGQTELLVRTQDLVGYFVLDGEGEWSRFKHMENVPLVDWEDPNMRLLDLNGDGVPDILITTDYCFRYYPSEEDTGYGERIEVANYLDEEQGPKMVFADAEQVIHTADMSGDGLTDIVRVRNGEVCYWPNLGYGRFGAKVSMPDAPSLDYPEQFNKSRVRLADMDGSGTTDLVYLGIDKVCYWSNQSGNRFSLETEIIHFPKTSSTASVSVMDLFGKGTSCLVWSSPLAGDAPYRIKYIDLFGEKPYLLKEVNNNMGGIGRYHYAPSTKFFLRDREEGNPWITKLPFPVQVVERTEQYDEVTGARFVSRYAYHHGYFDRHEKEFRGFGMVEQWDTEQYEHFGVEGLFQVGTNALDEDSHIPPIHTKTWFHLGFWEQEGSITKQFANEYFDGDTDAWELPDSQLPTGLNAEEKRQAMRALKGQALRSEVYADDETVLASVPYTVSSNNYLVKQIQPMEGNEYSVYQVIPQESLNYQYERNTSDPRISHSVLIETNDYGTPTKSASIAYPRRSAHSISLAPQDEGKITYSESDFTHLTNSNSAYRIDIPYEQRSYEVTGITFSSSAPFDRAVLAYAIANSTEISYETDPDGSTDEKRLISAVRAYYYNSDVDAALGYGDASYHGLPYRTLTLALTPGLVDDAFNVGATRVTETMLLNDGKYVKEYLDISGSTIPVYWVPSAVMAFDDTHFYNIEESTDPFGNTTEFGYDSYDLVATQTTDAVGNLMAATIDYRLMAIDETTDPNGNRQQVGFDVLGMVHKVAVMGKTSESLGDTLADPTQQLSYDLFNWMDNGKPNYVKTQAREEHGGTASWLTSYEYSGGMGQVILKKVQAEPGLAPERDGSGDLVFVGEVLQTTSTDPRWVGNGRTVFNNKGKAVKQYEPYFSDTEEFEDEDEVRQYGVTPILHYDPLGRVIRTDMPDGTFTKVAFDCWQQKNYDQNDTVIDSDWYSDRNSPSVSGSEPSDPDERAAWLSAKHYNTPQVQDLDVLGRVFRTRNDNGTYNGTTTSNTYYDVTLTLDIEAKKRVVSNALEQDTSFIYGILPLDEEGNGTILYTDSPDGGWRINLPNAVGNPIKGWNERGFEYTNEYDVLQRPTHAWVDAGSGDELVSFTVYGDDIGLSTPEDDNLRGQAIRGFDQSGMKITASFDFKGNMLASGQRLASAYDTTVDWSALDSETTLNDIDTTADSLLESETFEMSITYDALNRPKLVTQPDGSQHRPSFNEAGFLEKIEIQLQHEASFTEYVSNIEYDAKGQRTDIYYGNSSKTRYYYDPNTFRLTRLLTTRNSGADVLQDLNYTFDAVGNITELTDDAQQTHYFSNTVIAPKGKYEYDALYRLIKGSGRELTGLNAPTETGYTPDYVATNGQSANTLSTYCEEFTYDALGNILQLSHRDTCGGTENWRRTYVYNSSTPNNYLLSAYTGGTPPSSPQFTYDAHGNMLEMPHLDAMNWDYQDQLSSTDKTDESTYYIYSGEKRIRKVVVDTSGTPKIKYERIYLGSYELYREYDTSENLDLERATHHATDDKRIVGLLEVKTVESGSPISNGSQVTKTRYQYTNHLDSACLELDENAEIISYEEFHPFGSTSYQLHTNDTEVSLKRYKYVHKERDDETGLYYYGARYYAAWLCRFVSVDPLKDQRWWVSTFNFVQNNPINRTDPDGKTDFYNEQGKKVGTDGKDDGEISILTSKEDIKKARQSYFGNGIKGFINRIFGNGDQGTIEADEFTGDVVKLPSAEVRAEIGKAVERSNNPTADDTEGGFHEEGGIFGTTDDGSEKVVHSKPGSYSNPKFDGEATVNVFDAAKPEEQGTITNVEGTFHIHPSGSIVESSGGESSSPGTTISTTETRTTYSFVQPPSDVDVNTSTSGGNTSGYNIVVGAGNKTVYIHGTSGQNKPGTNYRATFPLDKFLSLGKKKKTTP